MAKKPDVALKRKLAEGKQSPPDGLEASHQLDEDSDFYVNEFDTRTPEVGARSLDVLTGVQLSQKKPARPPLKSSSKNDGQYLVNLPIIKLPARSGDATRLNNETPTSLGSPERHYKPKKSSQGPPSITTKLSKYPRSSLS